MPNHIEKAIRQLERWEESIQREKDHHAYVMSKNAPATVAWAFSNSRLEYLDAELYRTRALLANLTAQRHRPELILSRRPLHRMVKMTRPAKRKSA
jgi:hypothetical protein